MTRTRILSCALLALALGCESTITGDPTADPSPPAGASPDISRPDASAPDAAIMVDAAPPPPPPPAIDAPPAPPAMHVLGATWQGQQTYYWCGPGSTRIALSTLMGSPPSQQTLANYMGTTVDGTDNIGLIRGALNHYAGTTWFETKAIHDPPTQAQVDLLRRDLVQNISNGYPLVANVISGWRPPGYPGGTIYHYVAVIGYDQNGDRALIGDPAAEGSGGGSWGNVPRTYWISTYDLAVWIGGSTGYAA